VVGAGRGELPSIIADALSVVVGAGRGELPSIIADALSVVVGADSPSIIKRYSTIIIKFVML
jgi:hypothetical protein